MQLIESYNIHNLVSLQINTKKTPDIFKVLNNPIIYFQVEKLKNPPDIFINIDKFDADNHGCFIVDHKYFIKEDYFYCEDDFQGSKWKVEFKGFENSPSFIQLDISKLANKFILTPGILQFGLFLRQVISYHLLLKGIYLLHGSACAKDGKGLLFFGRGGSFKTSLAMKIMRLQKNWGFVGDDSVILDNGMIRSFPINIAHYSYRLKYLSSEELSLIDRLKLFPFSSKFTRPEYPIVDRSHATCLINCKAKTSGKLEIRKTDLASTLRALLVESAVDDHSNSGIGHAQIFPLYVEAYSYIYPDNKLKNRWAPLNLPSKIFNEVSAFELDIPINYFRKSDQYELDNILHRILEDYF